MTFSKPRARFDWSAPPGSTRPRTGKFAAIVSVTAIVLGAGAALYPSVTNVVAAHAQAALRKTDLVPIKDAHNGDPVMRLRILAIGLDVRVVEGTAEKDLEVGVGHYPDTGAPGDEGNVALAGHRTTYGKPFARLDELKPGDEIDIRSADGDFRYEIVRDPWVVAPTDWTPIRRFPKTGSFVTLTSCHPEGSASSRIVARARLVAEVSR
ncbi:MAG TPA: class E sortase [Actinomycetota bacterium]|nr:class E sortase [Actinomycetota bacterium]